MEGFWRSADESIVIFIMVKRAFPVVRTGTTNGPRDLSAIMYDKNLVVAVWTWK
jgi:membrane carboxypeptidase/penicillin-binding protein PbpC